MADDYTPSIAQATEMYAIARTPYLTRKTWFASREDPIRIALSEFDRMIAQVRAETLREAADAFESGEINVQIFGDGPDAEFWRRSNESRRHFVASLRGRADNIEKGAGL